MLGCGPGNSCCGSCQSGGVAAPMQLGGYFPRTEKVIADYYASQIEPGFGFWSALAASVSKVATTVAATTAKVAPTVAQIAAISQSTSGGGGSSGGGATAEQIAAAITPLVQAELAKQGVSLPNNVAQQAVQASILDSFGAQNRPYVIAAGAGLGLLLLLTLMRR